MNHTEISLYPIMNAAFLGFFITFLVCILIVITKRWHGVLTMDFTEGVQKFHTEPTPRIGGLPIVLGLIMAWLKTSVETREILTPILFAGMPAFIFGLAEDITKRVGVMQRLLATIASGLMACLITDYSLSRVDIWGVDWILQFTLISVIFTAFAVGGVANSINIIDGFNGLAGIMSTLAFIGFFVIASLVGDTDLANASLILAACVWGFFWVNWPFGKLFLGDGGSYFIGFALAWVAVLLIERNPNVSAFAALVVCVHPITEVVFSIYRRRLRKVNPGMPDRLHFHSLVKRRYVARWFGQYSNNIRNSITGAMIGFMTLVAIILAAFTYSSTFLSLMVLSVLSLGYVLLYSRMVKYVWCLPLKYIFKKSSQ